MQCPKCGADNAEDFAYCTRCGFDLRTATPQSGADERWAQAPGRSAPERAAEGDATGGVIPYKNPKALVAYYLGIFSGLPLIGLPLAVAALILGILGLKARRENPVIKGSIHAGIGIGCGCFFTLLWGGLILMAIIGLMAEP